MSKRPGNILLSHPVSGGGGWRVIPELSDDELRLIGLITTQWANLEHTLYEASNAFAEQLGITAHIDIEDISFDRRLRAFRDLAKVAPPEDAEHIRRLSDCIANLKDDRHKITHGLWDWDRSNPDRLTALSFRPKYGYEKPFDKQKLEKLADRIGECIFNIMFPNGWSPDLISSVSTRPLGKAVPFSEIDWPSAYIEEQES